MPTSRYGVPRLNCFLTEPFLPVPHAGKDLPFGRHSNLPKLNGFQDALGYVSTSCPTQPDSVRYKIGNRHPYRNPYRDHPPVPYSVLYDTILVLVVLVLIIQKTCALPCSVLTNPTRIVSPSVLTRRTDRTRVEYGTVE